ncbi:HlyC/CorC family transporter [Legionella genomosp. 1]|uniref:HlyC/CorC family transporter n=1 Tax=Legionella genomosp. 1 TaxID=1093625 RepID=UPI0010548473|nr:HlyC/CorC family transporter [Legionella genomosp. 1]
MQFSLATLSIILFILILLSAFFSGTEIGIMSINRYRLKHWVKTNHHQAVRVSRLLQRPDRLLGVILIGNTFANISASMIATLIGQRLYGNAGVALATLVLTLIILVLAEMVPKTLAALHPQQVAFRSSLPLLLLQKILAPLVYLISTITNWILRLFGISLDKAQREALSAEELRSVVNEAGGLLPAEHQGMLISLLDLEEATVEDIMIPKADVIGIDLEQPWHQILDELETAQHTRLPLFRHSIDDLLGMVHVRNVLNLVLEERLDKDSLLKIADAPYFVPEATPLNVQLLNFRKEKKRSCFVVDEYGDLQGLVTIEDILEEVIGEFTTDIAALSKDIVQENEETIIVDASITLRHLKRGLGWQLPMIGPRTLSGLIIEHLGYIPTADSCVQIEDFQIEILRVGDNMVKTARIRKVNRNEPSQS